MSIPTPEGDIPSLESPVVDEKKTAPETILQLAPSCLRDIIKNTVRPGSKDETELTTIMLIQNGNRCDKCGHIIYIQHQTSWVD